MKRKWRIRALLLAAYGVQYAYAAVRQDAVSGGMAGYGAMLVAFAVLCARALKTKNTAALCAGNALSFASSYAAASLTGMQEKGGYFKPLTAYSLIALLSLAAFLAQLAAVWRAAARRKRSASADADGV